MRSLSQVPYAVVKLARDSQRPTGLNYIQNIFTDFVELHGDRRYADDPAVVGGIARLGGEIVIPSGQDSLRPGDSVTIVTTHTTLRELSDILKK